ncbi:MAG: DUF4349 domain-containing protein [Chloroflexi bacterium]|nr:DUF4349 domain-containing protein [Chloroflexota bacterium]
MNEHNSTNDVEQRLEGYFEAKRKALKAPEDLWAAIEGRLAPPAAERKASASWLSELLSGRWRLAGAVAAVLVLLAASAAGILMARQFGGGPPALVAPALPGPMAPGVSPGVEGDVTAESREKALVRERQGELGFGAPPGAPPPAPTGLAARPAPQTAPAGPGAAEAPPPAPPAAPSPARAPAVVPSATPPPPLPAATPPPLTRPPAPTPAPRLAVPAPVTPPAAGGVLDQAQRQTISTAGMSLEVTAVGPAVEQLQAVAGELGGFVEQLTRSGGGEQEQATAVLRVPQDRFSEALSRLASLGKVQSQSLRSEDVTERFIDLEARLKTFQQEEQSLLNLLGRTQSVSEIVTVERELARVRAEIERIQGQLNFMKRRVDLATITVNLVAPARKTGLAPSASLTVEVSGVDRSLAEARALAASVNGSVDQVFLSRREGKDSASINLRVFRPDFVRVVDAVERQGELVQKDLREGAAAEAGAAPPDKPDAPVQVTYLQPDKPSRDWLKPAAVAGGVLLAALLAFLLLLVSRAARSPRGT